jgi:L-fucose isomerase-like protein
MQSVFTLLLAKAVTGETGFMGNILFINQPNNDVVIGHNTIGLKQANQFIIRTHVESGKGVTIQGILPETEITMLKCGNESLDNYFVSEGRIEENTNYVNACRTQIRIHLSNSVDYFINNPIGNHHIIIQGNYEKILSDFLSANSCKQII